MRKRKIMNPDDDYYSVKIPKFINVCPNIRHISPREREIFTDVIGHADSSLDNESESIDIQMNKTSNHLAKGEKSIISWCFDEDTYKKIKNAKNGTCDEDPPNDNLMDILNKTVVKEWMKEKCIKGESRNEEEATGRKETILVDHTDDSDMSYLTDDDLSDFANVEEFYECYQVTKNCHDMMSAPNMDPNDKVNILCNNMKYMDTNSFIAEYEDGKLIFFINEKPYILEHDKETNYLIESTEMNMMPIHCKLEKKFFIKSITRDEQNISPPKNLKLKNTDIYYSLYPVKK
ncbi:hypothetical protein, conserved [Plasmodium gonderi]|uniref:Uncharacterized protein n=1 Tax=Plasmodium gonderi TaxID=77519 RepID=A0A1Y1JQB8_PLAGO|nr:hypothetical protein, conserved [Plasmodium gonderi]GAW82254.1 hypothetical protein, conserved [Plasmodium gonderi]